MICHLKSAQRIAAGMDVTYLLRSVSGVEAAGDAAKEVVLEEGGRGSVHKVDACVWLKGDCGCSNRHQCSHMYCQNIDKPLSSFRMINRTLRGI